jgi:hypothetical protein
MFVLAVVVAAALLSVLALDARRRPRGNGDVAPPRRAVTRFSLREVRLPASDEDSLEDTVVVQRVVYDPAADPKERSAA